MGTNTAGAVQETHHRALRRGKPHPRTAADSCCPGLAIGIPVQTVTSAHFKVLVVLFVISGTQLSPSCSGCSVEPVQYMLDVRTAFTWIQTKTAPSIGLRSCKLSQEGQNHLDWTESMHISTLSTSTDSAPACTQTEPLWGSRLHRKLKKAALRGNYKHREVITGLTGWTLTALVKPLGSVVACSLSYLKLYFREACRNLWPCWSAQLKPSQVPAGLL